MHEPEPSSLRGTFAERAFPRLLFFLQRKKITGRLAVVDESGDKSIVFVRDGSVVHVDRPGEVDRLDKVLVATGALSHAKVEKAEQARAESGGRRLGDVIDNLGMLPPDKMAEALKNQNRRKLMRLFFPQRAQFEFFVDEHSFGVGIDFDLMCVEPRTLIYGGIRAAYDEDRINRELAPLSGKLFRLNPTAGFDTADMGFLPSDAAALAGLREAGLRTSQLTALGPKTADARAVVLTLLYTDMLEIQAVGGTAVTPPPSRAVPTAANADPVRLGGAGAKPAAAAAAKPGVAPAKPAVATGKPAVAATKTTGTAAKPAVAGKPAAAAAVAAPAQLDPSAVRGALVDLAKKLDSIGHYSVLGVSDTASPADVSSAYLRLVKQFHPDRLAGMGLHDLRADAERVMARASEASSVLSDPKAREEYGKTKERFTAADRAKAMRALDAEMAFQKGDALFKKGDWAKAEAAFADAVRGNPDEPEHKMMLAWVRYYQPSANKDKMGSEAIPILEEVAKLRPKQARVQQYLGEIWKQKNQLGKAEAAYRAALQIDHNLVDVQRELRLIEVRKQQKGKPEEKSGGGGFFDRLRKK